jgi:hypothetical protein
MRRQEFLRQSVSAFLLLANGRLIEANSYLLSEDHRRKVKLRFAVASDGHYGQPNTDFANFYSTVVLRINEEHKKHSFSFCVINGDVIHDDKAHFPAAKKALDALLPKYYVSQGNHDRVTHQEWESIWNMPVNLDFTIKENSFLVGTTSNETGTYLCPDLSWLRQKLEEHKGQDNVFIFIHINPGMLTKNAVDCPELFEIFGKYRKIRAVFNGHDHEEEGIKQKEKVPFIFDAHFGGNWGTKYHGFRIVELIHDNSIVTYIMNPTERINNAKLGVVVK